MVRLAAVTDNRAATRAHYDRWPYDFDTPLHAPMQLDGSLLGRETLQSLQRWQNSRAFGRRRPRGGAPALRACCVERNATDANCTLSNARPRSCQRLSRD